MLLAADVRATMVSNATMWSPAETGGMLIGYRAEHHGRLLIVVTGQIGAGPDADRGPARFAPDGHWQQRELEEAYARSGRTTTYLGDWHSHPRGRPQPSRQDLETFARVAADPDSRTELPLALIIALGRNVEIGAYGIDRHGDSVKLQLTHSA